jgi:hypothetical protein
LLGGIDKEWQDFLTSTGLTHVSTDKELSRVAKKRLIIDALMLNSCKLNKGTSYKLTCSSSKELIGFKDINTSIRGVSSDLSEDECDEILKTFDNPKSEDIIELIKLLEKCEHIVNLNKTLNIPSDYKTDCITNANWVDVDIDDLWEHNFIIAVTEAILTEFGNNADLSMAYYLSDINKTLDITEKYVLYADNTHIRNLSVSNTLKWIFDYKDKNSDNIDNKGLKMLIAILYGCKSIIKEVQ